MKNLNRIITESIHDTVNQIIQEDIDRQNRLCEQVMINEGLWSGLKTMWNGAKAFGGALGGTLRNAGAYAKQSTNFQLQLQKVNNANQVIQDMAKQGVINNSTLMYWNQQLAKYTQYLQNNINAGYNGGVDYRNTQAASFKQIQDDNDIPNQIKRVQGWLAAAQKKGNANKVAKYMQQIQDLKAKQQQLSGRQSIQNAQNA